MKRIALLMSILVIPVQQVLAAYQNFRVESRVPVIQMDTGQPGLRSYEVRRNNTYFRVEVLNDWDGVAPELSRNGKPFIAAQRDQRFAVRLYNPLPVRVAVNLTVDGLNSITGKPSGIADGDKWMIDPYSFITIRGWQVNAGEARRFFFTDKHTSYAQWTGERRGENLSVNCGVIGAAYFWSKKELDQYYEAHPEYRYAYNQPYGGVRLESRGATRACDVDTAATMKEKSALASPVAAAAQVAGTGMGERESNPTTLVDFSYDTGMYQVAQAIVIYYDFVNAEPVPNPFPALSYAPEMP